MLKNLAIFIVFVFIVFFYIKNQWSSQEKKSPVTTFNINLQKKIDNLIAGIDVNEPVKAIAFITQIIDTISNKQSIASAKLYYELGYYFEISGQNFQAKKNYETYLACYNLAEIPYNCDDHSSALKSLCKIYTQLGDYEKAIFFGKRALAVCENQTLNERTTTIVSYAHAELSNTSFLKKEYNIGLDFAKKNLTFLDNTKIENGLKKDLLYYGRMNLIKGFIINKDSINAFNEYLKILNEYPEKKIDNYQQIGLFYETFMDIPRAKDYYQRSIAVQEAIVKEEAYGFRELSKLYTKLSEFDFEMRNFDAALSNAHLALSKIYPTIDVKNIFQLPKKEECFPENAIIDALEAKSEAAYAIFQNNGKREWLELAKQSNKLSHFVSSQISSVLRHKNAKLNETLLNRSLFYNQFAMLIEEQEKFKLKSSVAEAFALAEKGRSQLMREEFQARQALQLVDNQTSNLINALRFSNSELEKEYLETQGAEAREIRKEIIKQTEEIQRLETALETQYPDYAKYKYSDEVVSFAAAKAKFAPTPQDLLLTYFYDEEKGKIYIIAGNQTDEGHFWVKPLARKDLDTCYQLLSNKDFANEQGLQTYSTFGKNLYDILLADAFRYYPNAQRLTLIPEGRLSLLPFEAFVMPDGNYVSQKVAMQYLPSATIVMKQLPTKQVEKKYTYLGIAPDYSNSFFDMVEEGENCVTKWQANFGGETLLKEGANDENFKKLAPSFQIIHFYGHAEADMENADQSYFAMTPKGKQSWWKWLFEKKKVTNNDMATLGGASNVPKTELLILAHEIEILNLSASLVVLSACKTGIGKIAEGEGIMSLSRVLFNAGARSTVTSQWSINSRTTAIITDSFFQYLKEGKRKDEALTLAKRDFLRNNPKLQHPYYWAGLTLSGNSEPIVF